MATKPLPPVHQGEIPREEFLAPMELSTNALACAIGVTPARVNDIANEKRGFTADTALRLGRYFSATADIWINLQKRLELEVTRRQLGDTLKHIHPRATQKSTADHLAALVSTAPWCAVCPGSPPGRPSA